MLFQKKERKKIAFRREKKDAIGKDVRTFALLWVFFLKKMALSFVVLIAAGMPSELLPLSGVPLLLCCNNTAPEDKVAVSKKRRGGGATQANAMSSIRFICTISSSESAC